jgi:outer membrane protein TolC
MMKRSLVVCLSFSLLIQPMVAQAPPSEAPTVTANPAAERFHGFLNPYVVRQVSPPDFQNSPRIHELMRGGNLYLSLRDAIALALENNLDIELERYAFPLAQSDTERTKGGGLPRGILYTLLQPPAGVGGPLSPLVTQAATQSAPGTTVSSNALELGVLSEPQTNLAMLGTAPLSNGSPVPAFDPSLYANYNWTHENILNSTSSGLYTGDVQTGNAGYQQGFSTGTQMSLGFNNTEVTTISPGASISPYIYSGLALNVTQPLLRGFGREINRRFIRIGLTQEKISSLLFRQQVIEVIYGVVRLYTDLVALTEDVKVKQETVAFAKKLFDDTKLQVDEGVLAPLELSRARAQVSGTEQDLINSRGLLEEQEAILKNVLTRRGNEDAEVRNARIIPTDSLSVPSADETRPMEELLAAAYQNRPDLNQAGLQIKLTQISLEGSHANLRPELDLVGTAQNNALAGQPILPTAAAGVSGGYGSILDQIATRKNPTYAIGLQLTLPLRNRVAQADAIRDEVILRQGQVRERQLRNQVQVEVEDALIAMRRARASYEAAVETRTLQEQSLDFEQTRYSEGVSTAFFVIQYESYVAQARSAEVASKGAYFKARAALQRAIGSIIDDNGVTMEQAIAGK